MGETSEDLVAELFVGLAVASCAAAFLARYVDRAHQKSTEAFNLVVAALSICATTAYLLEKYG